MGIREATNKFDEQLRKNCARMIGEEKRLNGIINGLVLKIDSFTTTLKKLQSLASQAQADIDKKASELKILQNDIQLKQEQATVLDNSCDKLNQNKEKLSHEIEAAENNFAETNKNHGLDIIKLQSEISQLQSTKNKLNDGIITLTKEYEELKHILETEGQSLNTLKDDISGLLKKQAKEKEELTEEKRLLDERSKKLDEKEQGLDKRNILLDNKDEHQKVIEKSQNDRDIAQNYRDIELRELSDKVHQLIKIHKLEIK